MREALHQVVRPSDENRIGFARGILVFLTAFAIGSVMPVNPSRVAMWAAPSDSFGPPTTIAWRAIGDQIDERVAQPSVVVYVGQIERFRRGGRRLRPAAAFTWAGCGRPARPSAPALAAAPPAGGSAPVLGLRLVVLVRRQRARIEACAADTGDEAPFPPLRSTSVAAAFWKLNVSASMPQRCAASSPQDASGAGDMLAGTLSGRSVAIRAVAVGNDRRDDDRALRAEVAERLRLTRCSRRSRPHAGAMSPAHSRPPAFPRRRRRRSIPGGPPGRTVRPQSRPGRASAFTSSALAISASTCGFVRPTRGSAARSKPDCRARRHRGRSAASAPSSRTRGGPRCSRRPGCPPSMDRRGR